MRKDQKVLPYVFNDKQTNIRNYVESMLNRTQSMFIYGNLPETISQRQLELKNQTHGFTIWCNVDESEIVQDPNSRKLEGGLYALNGGFGGIEDLNGDPTFVTIAHPRLKQSKVLKIDEECVLMRNDPFMQGLLPILERYCSMLVENDISINLADIMSRATAIITAGDDTTMENARMYIKKIIDGEISVIGELSSLEGYKGIETQPFMNGVNNTITNLIELQQYLKASMWNDLGLNANWNAKRESINSGESELNHDALLPLIDTMLHSRQEALAKINELFGTNITVELHSAWKDVQELHEEQDSDGDMQLDEGEPNQDETATEETTPGAAAMEIGPEQEDKTTENVIENEEPEIQPNGSIEIDAPTENNETDEDIKDDTETDNEDDEITDEELSKLLGYDVRDYKRASGRWVTIDDDKNPETPGKHVYIDDNGNFNNRAGFKNGKAVPNGTKDFPEDLEYGEDPGETKYSDAEPPESEEQLYKGNQFSYDSIVSGESGVIAKGGFRLLNKDKVDKYFKGANDILNKFGIPGEYLKVVNCVNSERRVAATLPNYFEFSRDWWKDDNSRFDKADKADEADINNGVDPETVFDITHKIPSTQITGAHEATHLTVGYVLSEIGDRENWDHNTSVENWNDHVIEKMIISRVNRAISDAPKPDVDLYDISPEAVESRTKFSKEWKMSPSRYGNKLPEETVAEASSQVYVNGGNKAQKMIVNLLSVAVKTAKSGGTLEDVEKAINDYNEGGKEDGE